MAEDGRPRKRRRCSTKDRRVYEPFEDAPTQIRLLKFRQCESEILSFDMTVWNKEDAPPYMAISYTWGDLVTESIHVNGIEVSVRRNCRYALWQAQMHFPNTFVWIDSICINQEDDQEKSKQVAAMFSVFSLAQRMVVSLGEPADDSDWLLAILDTLEAICTMLMKRHGLTWHHARFAAPLEGNDIWRSLLTLMDQSVARRLWTALVVFLQRPYWTRLWVLQELAAAPNSTILLCGQHSFNIFVCFVITAVIRDWHEPSMTWASTNAEELETGRDAILDWRLIVTFFFRQPHKISMREFYDVVAPLLQCADTRDKIYGIIPLLDWGEVDPILPDYSKSLWEVVLSIVPYFDLGALSLVLVAFGATGISSESQNAAKALRLSSTGTKDERSSNRMLLKAAIASDSSILCARLALGPSGKMIASFAKWEYMYARFSDAVLSGWDVISQNRHRSIRAQDVLPVYTGEELAALLCGEAEPGDIILPVGSLLDGLLLVVRDQRHATGTYDIIGQGFLVNRYCISTETLERPSVRDGAPPMCSCQQDNNLNHPIFSAKVEIHLTDVEAAVLVGQDMVGPSGVVDVDARLLRLITRPVHAPVGAVTLTQETCSGLW